MASINRYKNLYLNTTKRNDQIDNEKFTSAGVVVLILCSCRGTA